MGASMEAMHDDAGPDRLQSSGEGTRGARPRTIVRHKGIPVGNGRCTIAVEGSAMADPGQDRRERRLPAIPLAGVGAPKFVSM